MSEHHSTTCPHQHLGLPHHGPRHPGGDRLCRFWTVIVLLLGTWLLMEVSFFLPSFKLREALSRSTPSNPC
jgi:hypothetical protein